MLYIRVRKNEMNNRIAVIVTWFGQLPQYFPAWLKSAECNPTIDFYCFFDHLFSTKAKNIYLIETTMEREVERIEKETREKIQIDNSYKFCDLRAFFGITYQKYIKNYDFWGYCDIDMVFGNLRHFLTDSVLNKYDRFYEWGYLSIFRNNDQMNHLIEMDGGIYTKDEIFRGKAKCTPEEHYGLHRISKKNNIKWYTEKNFADFYIPYTSFILNQKKNFEKQAFYWEDGKVYRAYIEDHVIKNEELAFLHWQKRKPLVEKNTFITNAYFITPTKLVSKEKGVPSEEEILYINPILSEKELDEQDRQYRKKKIKEFMKTSFEQKKIWLRQKKYYVSENKSLIESKRKK